MSEMAQELEEALDRLEDYLEVWLSESQVDDTNSKILYLTYK
jgi:hypothetical protein